MIAPTPAADANLLIALLGCLATALASTVIVVQMRQQHGVQPIRRRRDARLTHHVQDPLAEHRVGQHARAGDLDQDGRVAEPGDGHGTRLASVRVGCIHPPRVMCGHPE